MRYCFTCRKVAAGTNNCPTPGACKIVSDGWKPRPPNDAIQPAGSEGTLIGELKPWTDKEPAMVEPYTIPGDAAPPYAQAAQPMPCLFCGLPRYGACGRDVDFCRAKSERLTEPKTSPPPERLTLMPDSGTVAHSILTEAASIVEGVRNDQHGHKERSFVAIAADWTAYLATRQDPTGPIRAHDVAQMMVRMKMQRAEWGTPLRDHFVDQAGYAGIAGELALSKKET